MSKGSLAIATLGLGVLTIAAFFSVTSFLSSSGDGMTASFDGNGRSESSTSAADPETIDPFAYPVEPPIEPPMAEPDSDDLFGYPDESPSTEPMPPSEDIFGPVPPSAPAAPADAVDDLFGGRGGGYGPVPAEDPFGDPAPAEDSFGDSFAAPAAKRMVEAVEAPPETTSRPRVAATRRYAQSAPAPTYAPAAVPAADPTSSEPDFDRELEELPFGQVAYNRPTNIPLAQTVTVEVVLSRKKTTDELKERITSPGEKQGARIRVAKIMEATLEGQDFEIKPTLPKRQTIIGDENRWTWQVTPKREGKHPLELNMSVVLSDGQTLKAYHTFTATIEVDVSLAKRVSSFTAGNWQWLWTTLLFPAYCWLVSAYRNSKSADKLVDVPSNRVASPQTRDESPGKRHELASKRVEPQHITVYDPPTAAKESWLVGSSPDCDLIVDAQAVSGQHCRLLQKPDGFYIEDLGSTNGTYVNGIRLRSPTRVAIEDQVTLGKRTAFPWPPEVLDAGSRIISIGKSQDNDIVLDHQTVSGHHAQLIIRGKEKMVLEDLQSTNGTYVGTTLRRIESAPVRSGETVFFGKFEVKVGKLLGRLH